jgi:hypothetical protein
MKKTLRVCALTLVALSAMPSCGDDDYATMMQKKVATALGNDFREYRFFSYPTNDYGVGTAYVLPSVSDAPSDKNFFCDSQACLSGSGPTIDASDLTLGGYAAVGGGGGTIALSEKEQSSISANLVLPQVYGLLKVGASAGSKSGVTTSLTIDQAYPRKLQRGRVYGLLSAQGVADSHLKEAFNKGTLAFVVGDVVIKAMTVDICVDKASNAALDAALSSNVGKVLGSGSSFSVQVAASTTGCYKLMTSKPVVAAALVAKQPKAGGLEASAGDDFLVAGWKRSDLGASNRGRLEVTKN